MRKGNPYLQIRLEPHVLELLKARIPAGEPGRGGGVAHYVRSLIYHDLGLGEPPRFAAEPSPRRRSRRNPAEEQR